MYYRAQIGRGHVAFGRRALSEPRNECVGRAPSFLLASLEQMTTEECPSLENLISPTGCYAGIGARSTPATNCNLIEAIAETLATRGMTLRSGAAPGADMAFECGCDWANGKKRDLPSLEGL